jgi:hypothetical protein
MKLSLRVVLVLPEGIKVNAGVCVCRRGRDVGECTLFWPGFQNLKFRI